MTDAGGKAEASVVEQARDALRRVIDPELGLDIVALGLVYGVRLEDDSLIVEMTLTTPGCPVAESLPYDAASAVVDALGAEWSDRVDVRMVWEPAWTPDRIEETAAGTSGFRRR